MEMVARFTWLSVTTFSKNQENWASGPESVRWWLARMLESTQNVLCFLYVARMTYWVYTKYHGPQLLYGGSKQLWSYSSVINAYPTMHSIVLEWHWSYIHFQGGLVKVLSEVCQIQIKNRHSVFWSPPTSFTPSVCFTSSIIGTPCSDIICIYLED